MTIAVAQLLRLASPALPIGGFAWSGGLEGAVEEGLVTDPASAQGWIEDALLLVHARWDAAILWRLLNTNDYLYTVRRPRSGAAIDDEVGSPLGGEAARRYWSQRYLASRETHELRQETLAMGQALASLLASLDGASPNARVAALPLPHAWALAADAWHIAAEPALDAWLVAFVENQLAVLQKAVPLGQVAVQRLFSALLPTLERAATIARTIADDALSSSTPGLAIVSSRHEHQYSRLFRS